MEKGQLFGFLRVKIPKIFANGWFERTIFVVFDKGFLVPLKAKQTKVERLNRTMLHNIYIYIKTSPTKY